MPFGAARVVYPEASEERCTATLIVRARRLIPIDRLPSCAATDGRLGPPRPVLPDPD
jgi:hypothetical protein